METDSTQDITNPATIEFAGLVWKLVPDDESSLSPCYGTTLPGVGDCHISQYTGGYSRGRWYYRNDMFQILSGEYKPATLARDVSGITDTREQAVQACVDARANVQKDLQKMLLALGIGDPYSVGFRDGQAAMKDKITRALEEGEGNAL